MTLVLLVLAATAAPRSWPRSAGTWRAPCRPRWGRRARPARRSGAAGPRRDAGRQARSGYRHRARPDGRAGRDRRGRRGARRRWPTSCAPIPISSAWTTAWRTGATGTRPPLSTDLLDAVTNLGEPMVVAALAAVLALVETVRTRSRWVVPFLLVVVAGNGILTTTIKHLADRVRPALNPIAETLGPSFPSGHSSWSAAFFAAAALLLGRGRGRGARAAIAGVAAGLALTVAGSRVLLGVHWLSDVIAGLALGSAWFAICAVASAAGCCGSEPRRARRRGWRRVVASAPRVRRPELALDRRSRLINPTAAAAARTRGRSGGRRRRGWPPRCRRA